MNCVEDHHAIHYQQDRSQYWCRNGRYLSPSRGSKNLTLLLILFFNFLTRISNIRDKAANQSREALCSENTSNWSKSQHETNHDSSKVPRHRSIKDQEDVSIAHILEKEVDSHRSQRNNDLQLQEEGCPSGRLMLRHRSNDGYVLGGISRIQQSQ